MSSLQRYQFQVIGAMTPAPNGEYVKVADLAVPARDDVEFGEQCARLRASGARIVAFLPEQQPESSEDGGRSWLFGAIDIETGNRMHARREASALMAREHTEHLPRERELAIEVLGRDVALAIYKAPR